MKELLIVDAQQVAGGLTFDMSSDVPPAQTAVLGAALGDFLVTGSPQAWADSINNNLADWTAMTLNTMTVGGFVVTPL